MSEKKVLVKGIRGSPGSARGRVRVLKDVSEAGEFCAGDILVTSATSPIWTPLIHVAAAVVTDVGGALSHAAIVCREYGIPAVVGTGDGTKRLEDVDFVEVDGNEGVVYGIGA